jgi:hypothetical protein
MNAMAQITPLLKQLRLSEILDSLEIRNRQPIDQKPSYSEFLALLIRTRRPAVITGSSPCGFAVQSLVLRRPWRAFTSASIPRSIRHRP